VQQEAGVLTDLDLVEAADAGYAANRVVQQGARAAAASFEAALAVHRVSVAGGMYSLAAARAWLAFGFLGLAVTRPRFHDARLTGAPEDATFVELDGVHVRYRDAGHGDAVVLVHGYGASSESWLPVMPALIAAGYRVIALDLKGFGWSSRPAGDYSPAAQAHLVWRVLDALGVTEAALVGHSWGSSVVLAMAVAAPARVRRVALYAAYVYDDQVPPVFRLAERPLVGELLFGLYYKERVENRVAFAFADDRFVTQHKVDRLEAELARPGTVAAALATARRHHFSSMHRALRTFDRPVILLWGEHDQVTPLRFGRRLAGELVNARMRVYPNCGHVPMVEAHAASTADLVAFLDEDGDQP
jgi:pimeloyl-ACP methyl ester carboxylesterase